MKLHEQHFQWRDAKALAAGDVYILPRESGYWVCMASLSANGDAMFAVVLGEEGGASGDPVPRFVNLDALNADMVARCVDPRIGPIGANLPLGLAMPGSNALPGNLAYDGKGQAYLYIRQQGAVRYFDITGGPTLPQLNCRAAFKAWQVVSLAPDEKPVVLATHTSPA